jgi:hypothetical protein
MSRAAGAGPSRPAQVVDLTGELTKTARGMPTVRSVAGARAALRRSEIIPVASPPLWTRNPPGGEDEDEDVRILEDEQEAVCLGAFRCKVWCRQGRSPSPGRTCSAPQPAAALRDTCAVAGRGGTIL